MIIHLHSEYPDEGYIIYASDYRNAVSYQEMGYRVCHITGQRMHFIPEDMYCDLTEVDLRRLEAAGNHDIFLLSSDGRLVLVYEASSGDNVLLITGRCNSNCIMCPTHDNYRRHSTDLTLSSALTFIDYMPEDADHITITGGEPFMMGEAIFPVLQKLKAKQPYTDYLLLTNGRALAYQPYFEKFLQSTPDRMLVGIPVHGHNADRHDRITRAPGSFEQTRIAVRKLVAAGIRVEIRLVISKLNYDDISSIGDLIVREFKGVTTVKFMGLEMLGNAAKYCEDVWITYSDAWNYSKTAVDKIIQSGIDVGLYNFPLCAVDLPYHALCQKSITSYKVRFPAACDTCRKKDACGGFFAGSMRLAGKDVVPWR